jgi:hypothetical protein
VTPAEAPTRRTEADFRRRAGDDRAVPTDLAPGEFWHPAVGPGTHSISIGVSGHEHGIGSGLDPARGTVTCLICEAAVEEAAKLRDVRRLTIEISAELWFDLKNAARGKPIEVYAAELLAAPQKR